MIVNPIKRKPTRKIRVGSVYVGGDAPISIQSMTNTETCDVEATLAQIQRCADVFNKTYLSSDINLEYLALPFYKFSPYVYAGGGNLGFHNSHNFKTQIGGGIEYLFKNTAFRLNIQYDMGTDDNWDQFTNGKRKDQAVRLGLGINYYFGNKK